MKVCILSANLGSFDKPIAPITQETIEGITIDYHCFTDEDFPPITGLTSRLQYRIPKLFGWDIKPGYDVYIWLDGSMSLQDPQSVYWLLQQLGDADMAVFKHPWRKTIKEEVDHIEQYLEKKNEYITSRYKNGLHKEQFKLIREDRAYLDDKLFASTAFVYRNNKETQDALVLWWLHQSRYFTCDQIAMTYVLNRNKNIKVNVINENVFKIPYINLVSKHK